MQHQSGVEIKRKIDDLNKDADALGLSTWELGFLDSVGKYRDFSKLSPKQQNVIINIWDKYYSDRDYRADDNADRDYRNERRQ
jgi:hypothetical protein